MTTHQNQPQDRLREIYAKIKDFEGKAKELRNELDHEIEGLRDKDSKLYRQFEDVKYASTAAFYEIRQGFEKASDSLREAIKKAGHHFQ